MLGGEVSSNVGIKAMRLCDRRRRGRTAWHRDRATGVCLRLRQTDDDSPEPTEAGHRDNANGGLGVGLGWQSASLNGVGLHHHVGAFMQKDRRLLSADPRYGTHQRVIAWRRVAAAHRVIPL